MVSSKGEKILKIVVIIEAILLVFNSIFAIIIYTKPNLEYYNYNKKEYYYVYDKLKSEYESIKCDKLNNEQITNEVQKVIPLNFFIYIEKKDLGDAFGRTIFLLRIIEIKKGLTGTNYAITLMHEYYHLYNYNPNERITQYYTFIYLYENECLFLKKSGLILAINIMEGQFDKTYNCTSQIINYFLNKEGTFKDV